MESAKIEERFTGWLDNRSNSTRRQSLHRIIGKLQYLSNGLFSKDILTNNHRMKGITERDGPKTRLNKSQPLITMCTPTSSKTMMKIRQINSALPDIPQFN
jgi:hypothetical protein